jgi:hypothetical protein
MTITNEKFGGCIHGSWPWHSRLFAGRLKLPHPVGWSQENFFTRSVFLGFGREFSGYWLFVATRNQKDGPGATARMQVTRGAMGAVPGTFSSDEK